MKSKLEADTPIERPLSLKSKIGHFPAFFWEDGRKLVPGCRALGSNEDQVACRSGFSHSDQKRIFGHWEIDRSVVDKPLTLQTIQCEEWRRIGLSLREMLEEGRTGPHRQAKLHSGAL